MKRKIFFIQIMRIVACMGVFTGHFLGFLGSELGYSILCFLREKYMHKTVLSYFWQGDSDVVIFLVLGGFFITFIQTEGEVSFPIEKLGRKLAYVFVPALLIWLLTVLCCFVLYILGYNSLFDVKEIFNDFIKLVKGGIPYYASHLWYIRTLIFCYVRAYAYVALCGNKYIRRVMYPFLLVISYIKKYNIPFILGMICGEICSYLCIKDKRNGKIGIIIATIALMVSPFTYNQYHKSDDNQIMLSIIICIFILAMIFASGKILSIRSNLVDWLDRCSFSCYLIHFLFIDTVAKGVYKFLMIIYDGKYEGMILLFTYLLSVLSVWKIADLYEKHAVCNIMKYVDKIISYLKINTYDRN